MKYVSTHRVWRGFLLFACFHFSFQYEVRNSSLQLAELEQQKADEDFMKLADDQKVCGVCVCIINH